MWVGMGAGGTATDDEGDGDGDDGMWGVWCLPGRMARVAGRARSMVAADGGQDSEADGDSKDDGDGGDESGGGEWEWLCGYGGMTMRERMDNILQQWPGCPEACHRNFSSGGHCYGPATAKWRLFLKII